MKEIIKKAAVLIEALPYIQSFRGEIIVVKFGGSVLADENLARSIFSDVTFMECIGMLPVIVHGGGKAISAGMKEEGVDSKFVKGLRVTCEKSIEVVEKVLNDEVNPSIVKMITDMDAKAQGVQGQDVFNVVKKVETDSETGEMMDWGFVGEPMEVNTAPILELLKNDIIPVVTPLGTGEDGKVHNINADTAAAAMAKALFARKLAFLSDVPGLMNSMDDNGSVISTLDIAEVEDLVKRGVVEGGMLPKVESGVDALHSGVRKVHIIDARLQHSLLLEIFTDKGIGTEIVSNV